MKHTLWVIGLAQERTRLLAVYHGPVDCGDVGDSMTQVPLELVRVIRALAPTAQVLAVDGVDAQPPGAEAKDERVL